MYRLDFFSFSWLEENIGDPNNVHISDHWWQTETGWPITGRFTSKEPVIPRVIGSCGMLFFLFSSSFFYLFTLRFIFDLINCSSVNGPSGLGVGHCLQKRPFVVWLDPKEYWSILKGQARNGKFFFSKSGLSNLAT